MTDLTPAKMTFLATSTPSPPRPVSKRCVCVCVGGGGGVELMVRVCVFFWGRSVFVCVELVIVCVCGVS